MKESRAAIYARVSTEDQHNENQVERLKDYAKLNKYNVTKIYTDVMTGKSAARPALQNMIQDMRKRRFDILIVWSIDRLGRSLQHLLQTVQEFEKHGVDFVCITQPIDTSSPHGKFTFTILGAVAELERELIRERVKLGMDRAKKEGKHVGRPKGSKDKKKRKRRQSYAGAENYAPNYCMV